MSDEKETPIDLLCPSEAKKFLCKKTAEPVKSFEKEKARKALDIIANAWGDISDRES